MNKLNKDTFLQAKLAILTEQMKADPELKLEVEAYLKLVDEFGVTEMPVYLKEKFAEIDLMAEARMNGLGKTN